MSMWELLTYHKKQQTKESILLDNLCSVSWQYSSLVICCAIMCTSNVGNHTNVVFELLQFKVETLGSSLDILLFNKAIRFPHSSHNCPSLSFMHVTLYSNELSSTLCYVSIYVHACRTGNRADYPYQCVGTGGHCSLCCCCHSY